MTIDVVDRIAIGGGSPEGANSAYLVDERIVVDPGPPTDEAWNALRAGLESAGLSVDALESVLVTHWHVDHAGLAPRLAEAADASIAMGAGDAPLVGDYAAARERRLTRDRATLRRWGVPETAVETVIEGDSVSPMPESVPVQSLEDGDEIAALEAVSTPGHTLGHTAFAGDGFVLVGDAVLPTYTPNVGGSDTRTLAPHARDGAAGPLETDPLGTFLDSLERLVNRSARLLPGHGTAVQSDRIETIRTHHEERSQRVLGVLESDAPTASPKPMTPWELALDLFGALEGVHVKFGAGEAAAHCRHLEQTGRIERVADDPVRYAVRE